MRFHLGALVSLALVLGCGGGSGDAGGVRGLGGLENLTGKGGATGQGQPDGTCTPPAVGNNSATCVGDLGDGTSANSTLAKSVPVTLTNRDFVASVGYVTRLSTSSDYTSFIIPLTNVGSSAQCFISIATGQAGNYELFSYITGSVGYSGSTYTDTCLAPSESGYLVDITNEVTYDAVSSISLTLSGNTGLSISSARVFPTSFAYGAGVAADLAVTVSNAGALAVDLAGGFHQLVLLDDANRGLDFTYLDAVSTAALQPGASDQLATPLVFHGSASRMVVMVDFEGTGTTGALTLAPRPEDLARLEAVRAHRARVRAAWAARD